MLNSMVLLSLRSLDLLSAHHCSARSAPPLQRAQCTTTAPHQPGALTCMRMLNSMVLLSLRSLDLLSAHHCSARSAPPLQRAQCTTTAARAVHHHCATSAGGGTDLYAYVELHGAVELAQFGLVVRAPLQRAQCTTTAARAVHHHCSARSAPPLQRAQCTTTAARAVHHHCSARSAPPLQRAQCTTTAARAVAPPLRHISRGH
ncbi:hypothetical protein O0L34_g6409 [Tuta absoluta]|nr:hypothetical protein O0L34_g6409 [Tuta absoluta]